MLMLKRTIRGLIAAALFAGLALAGAETAAQQGPFNNASLRGTYTYVAIFGNANEPYPNSAIAGLLYFDGTGGWVFANLITNLPGEPDAEGNPTRFLMNSLDDLTLPWPHVRGTYAVNPDGSFRYLIERGQGAFDAVVTEAERVDGRLMITRAVMVDTAPSRFGGGLVVFDLWRIVDDNILPPE
jgi:hypothetical protein